MGDKSQALPAGHVCFFFYQLPEKCQQPKGNFVLISQARNSKAQQKRSQTKTTNSTTSSITANLTDGIQKAKKEAHVTPKPKTKAWKAKKAVLKGIHSHRKRSHYPPSGWPTTLQRQPNYPWKSNKLNHYVIIKFPLSRELVMKTTEDSNTLVFIMDIKDKVPHL
ncbi:hypothetical protein Celaphus_00018891 [Cervus elaphus hippelaphus]|uniref:Large ribosomal subunit protein uL23 N-terminal domain-containing protein n=1 Tax=Cervus elaphus hippelaphus TaxID=46360 RepID=A0A212C621_CEREH|nr:hypothetical protein Celaphus_00018891 [Cervus elaphus hippelaphus]